MLLVFKRPKYRVAEGEFAHGVTFCKRLTEFSYFGAFQDSTLRTFYDAFTKFEVSFLLEDLQKHGITDNSSTADGKTLADVSPAVVCYILSDPRILGDAKIYDIVQRHAPKQPITGLPMDAPPVGLFMLAIAPTDDTRRWAQAQLTTYTVTPMPADHYLPVHSEVLAAATNTIHPGSLPCELTLPSCTTDKAELWTAYSVFLRYTPRDKIPSGVVPVVIAHLYDTDSRSSFYLLILRCCLCESFPFKPCPRVEPFNRLLRGAQIVSHHSGPKRTGHMVRAGRGISSLGLQLHQGQPNSIQLFRSYGD